ncbi:MAG: dTDP-4-dehydrorhamnose 3,5-epimerase [Flavobacteriales bacterium]|nr:dTDP-4-dehydrorhamnose 3,5-epimerase [Flavobacteriales bacterium]MCB9364035.1 dTDP-4-dehydrorhamnose 3,5-epimerase [Flavobacteriales bacterium]
MEIKELELKGVYLIKPNIFEDERGHFFESFNQNVFKEKGLNLDFVQDNQSLSQKGVLRGLHFQKPPYAQGKLIRVIKGRVLDVAVDIRKKSPTYGKSIALELSEENKLMFYIPEGFAHGFLTLEDNTIFSYKCTNFFNKASEGSLLWNDADLNIDWGNVSPLLSEKDKEAPVFSSFDSPF